MRCNNLLSMCAAVAITAGGALLFAQPAPAKPSQVVVVEPGNEIVVRHISYADLNLASDGGMQTLQSRVRGGISDLCAEAVSAAQGSFTYNGYSLKCRSSAWNQAKPQVARAVQRAREIALTGSSTLAATAITISLPQ